MDRMTRMALLIWTINVLLAIVIVYTWVAGRWRRTSGSETRDEEPRPAEDRHEHAGRPDEPHG